MISKLLDISLKLVISIQNGEGWLVESDKSSKIETDGFNRTRIGSNLRKPKPVRFHRLRTEPSPLRVR
jgi:hypothetical protein